MCHEPKDMETNPYLMKLVSYLSVVMPDFKFNSALINRYTDSGKHIPHHSDNEDAIDPSSDILTVSLGASRIMEFKNLQTGKVLQAPVRHGTVISMSKESQFRYSHSILKGEEDGLRISITFRLIKEVGPEESGEHRSVGIQTDSVSCSCGQGTGLTSMLYNLDSATQQTYTALGQVDSSDVEQVEPWSDSSSQDSVSLTPSSNEGG